MKNKNTVTKTVTVNVTVNQKKERIFIYGSIIYFGAS